MKTSTDKSSWTPLGIFVPVVESLRSFKGNARTCILVEPLWGISYNLFVPYTSLYMLALGVDALGIGLIATVTMVLQTLWSLTAGIITDRFGRRRTSLVFDTISWSIPTLLWAFAQDFRWFLAAGIFNAAVRVVHVSWSCLFIEDAPVDLRVRLYTWMSVAGTLSGFFAPLAGFFVDRFGLVPATRGLYGFAFLAMTSMIWIRNAKVKETSIGIQRMREIRTKGRHTFWKEYRVAATLFLGNRSAVIAFLLALLSNIHLQVRNNFLSVVMTRGIGLPPAWIALFPFLATGVTLMVYFLVIPRIKNIRKSLTITLLINTLGNIIFFVAPDLQTNLGAALFFVVLGTLVMAVGMGVSGPVIDAILANSVDEKTRAVTLSIVYTMMFGLSAPFGWFSGFLAELQGRYPALLMALLMFLSTLLALRLRQEKGHP